MRHLLTRFLLLFLIISTGCNETEVVPQLTSEEEQMALGNPSGATADPPNHRNFLVVKPQFALSYNRDRGIPNWVSWHVNKDWIGIAPRQNNFRADATLPNGWYQVTNGVYTGSGFDRGHNVPSADRTSTAEDNAATFLMTNIIPQAPKNNQETWANLEDYTRDLVGQGNEVYVVMGNYGIGGTGSNGKVNTIDQGRVTVPSRIWKVLVILPEGENDVNRINNGTRVIAVDTPNNNTLSSDWGSFRVTVDAVEQATGFDLLSSVPENVQQVVEARVDAGPTR